ncbi:hypothetical protein M900_A0276 [Bacteriovorax sp. Seq25_V]|nr:hypothetical protein M900_A0276 [Bacteriovorax sp. Seq25_V]
MNAKLVDENFVILGKSIRRDNTGNFIAKDAEYTTCRDCPESWSIQGSDVKVVPNEYIYLKHTFVKVKGVVVLYIPYLVLPIKKDRESGLLFPKFGFDLDKGFYFQQPYFQVINKSSDLTLSPTSYGRRAIGGEFEYRKVINSESNFDFFGMEASDKIWRAEKTTSELEGSRNLRQFYDTNVYYKPNHKFSIFGDVAFLSDLDIQADYDIYLNERLIDNEHGLNFGTELNLDSFSITGYGSFKNNSFFNNAKGFDHSYVQNIGTVEIAHTPYAILENLGFLNRLSFSESIVFSKFKQNHRKSETTQLNLSRIDYTPKLSLDVTLFNFLNFESSLQFDGQYYYLDDKNLAQTARKYGKHFKNSLWLELEKSYGQAYVEKVEVQQVSTEMKDSSLITNVPQLDKQKREKSILHSSYKHLLKFELAHSYYKKQKYSGNTSLIESFEDESQGTRFDERDIIRGSDSVLFDSSTRTDLPESNTIEFSFFNSLLRKTPRSNYSPFESFKYNYNNFDVTKVFYFNISQGLLVGPNYEDFDDRLARLATSFGINIGKFNLSGSEYYFHQNQKHITSIGVDHTVDYFKYRLSYSYDSFSEQRRYLESNFTLSLSDMIELRTGHYYDFELQRVYESYVGALYSPDNNCWKFDLEYRQKDKILDNVKTQDRIISFNFLLNYSSKGFNSLLGLRI